MMSRATRFAWMAVTLCACVAIAMSVGFFLVRWQIEHSQAQWCDTLRLLTSRPVPKPPDPVANPSREDSYLFYMNLLDLRHRFGCG